MSDNRWSADRRTFLKTTGAASAVGLAGCLGGGDGNENRVRFILNPAEADVEITEQYQPVFDYLESETSAEIEADRTESYAGTLQAMRNDQGEVADISPSAVIAGENVVDIIGKRIAYGAAQYFSTITTTMDSGVEELTDLEGEGVNFSDVLSVSGSLTPLTMLSRAGLDIGDAPAGDPADFESNHSDHVTALEQMIERDDAVAAGTGAFVSAPLVSQEQFDEHSQDFVELSAEYDGAGDEIGDEYDELDLLAVSDPLPRAPLVSRSGWDASVREEVEQALVDAPTEAFEHEEGYEGEPLWFTGVEDATIDDYEPIREIMNELDLEFEDLS